MTSPCPQDSDLGKRVSIRLNEPTGGYRDLLGFLVGLTTVEKKDGTRHEFDPGKIAAWKVVPTETTMRINQAK